MISIVKGLAAAALLGLAVFTPVDAHATCRRWFDRFIDGQCSNKPSSTIGCRIVDFDDGAGNVLLACPAASTDHFNGGSVHAWTKRQTTYMISPINQPEDKRSVHTWSHPSLKRDAAVADGPIIGGPPPAAAPHSTSKRQVQFGTWHRPYPLLALRDDSASKGEEVAGLEAQAVASHEPLDPRDDSTFAHLQRRDVCPSCFNVGAIDRSKRQDFPRAIVSSPPSKADITSWQHHSLAAHPAAAPNSKRQVQSGPSHHPYPVLALRDDSALTSESQAGLAAPVVTSESYPDVSASKRQDEAPAVNSPPALAQLQRRGPLVDLCFACADGNIDKSKRQD